MHSGCSYVNYCGVTISLAVLLLRFHKLPKWTKDEALCCECYRMPICTAKILFYMIAYVPGKYVFNKVE